MLSIIQILLAFFIWYKVIPYVSLIIKLRNLTKSDNWDTVNKNVEEWRKD